MKYVKDTLRQIDAFRRKRNTDWRSLVVGPSGSGKSNFSLWAASLIAPDENIRIVNTALDFLRAVNEIPQYGVIVYDEGLRGLMARQAMQTENVEQIKALAQMRQNKNLIVFIITQDFSMMEKHVRSVACKGIFRCTFHDEQQGVVIGYGPKAIPQIKIQDGLTKYPNPDWVDQFPSIKDTAIWKKYEEMEGQKKAESTMEGIKKIEDVFHVKSFVFNLSQRSAAIPPTTEVVGLLSGNNHV